MTKVDESTATERSSLSSGSSLGKRSSNDSESTLHSSSGSDFPFTRRVKSKLSDSVVDIGPEWRKDEDQPLPVIIANSHRHQDIFDARKLSTGVQWEIARLVSMDRLSYHEITIPQLDLFKGPNAEAAPKVAEVILSASKNEEEQSPSTSIAREIIVTSPWLELDREEAALESSPLRGLGREDDWYGGKVQFIGKLKEKDWVGPSGYAVVLERPQLGASNRFARRFGSKRFLRIKIPKKFLHKSNSGLVEYFSRPFILNGRVFRSFFAKERNVFMIETNEEFRDEQIISPAHDLVTPDGRMSLYGFLNWHNPMTSNSNQTMAKWAARFALGLSNSIPGLELHPSCVKSIDDIISPSFKGHGKPPSEFEMTDGCGYANATLLRFLRDKFDWATFPTAIQCRIGGAKGLLTLHPSGKFDDNPSATPQVEIRPSQIKIKYPEHPLPNPDPTNLTLDLLRPPRLKSPSRLSAEVTVNLAENGVPDNVFLKLMEDGLTELVSGLTKWDGGHAMTQLWLNVAQVGGVISARIARELGGQSRAKGYGQRDDEDEDEDEDEDALKIDTAIHPGSVAWWADTTSGCPSSLEETVMVLLDSGFTPMNCPVLAEKLKQVLKTAVKRYVERYKITVPMSCEAFIIPDPFGVLQPGQIHIKSSQRLKGPDGFDTDQILGDVLVTRHPCKVPSDVQKVTAVFCSELRHFLDVIVFPIHGYRSLASMLGGGDYDGDVSLTIWQPEIVSQFKNACPSFADPPADLHNSFTRNNETVATFIERVQSGSHLHLQNIKIQKHLLGALQNPSVVGTYSSFHDNAVYKLGYKHPETIRLAYMFCACLDGSKTGLTVTQEAYSKDKNLYQCRPPNWKETDEDRIAFEHLESNEGNMKRGQHLHSFIMDKIKARGAQEESKHMCQFANILKEHSSNSTIDSQLAHPWKDAQIRAAQVLERMGTTGMKHELESIADHVRKMRVKHREKLNITPGSPKKGKKGAKFTSMAIETRQDILRSLSKEFASAPTGLIFFSEDEVKRIKASYAYVHDIEEMSTRATKWTRFPFDVATRQLCEIKAKALGPSKTISPAFYDVMTVHPFVRTAS